MNMVERTECNRPHSRYPPSLHALNGINAVSRGFSGGKEVIKSANTKTSRSSLDIIKWQIMVEVIIFTSLDAVTTIDVLTASK